MRPIDADALIPMIKYATTDSEIGVFPIKIGFDAIVKVINAQPTIEPKTEWKKGKWIEISNYEYTYKCSVCGRMLTNITDGKNRVAKNYPFCHCGADMRGKKDAE